MKYYLNTFIIYSVLGFIFETTLKYLFFPNMNNGFLIGPWIPIYGLGSCIIIFIMRLVFNRFKVKRFIKVISLFFMSSIILTLLEFIGGNLIEILTDKVFWKYDKLMFNFGHYIALEISIVWGIMSLVVTYILKPLLDKLVKKIPNSITYSVLLLIIIDFIYSFTMN